MTSAASESAPVQNSQRSDQSIVLRLVGLVLLCHVVTLTGQGVHWDGLVVKNAHDTGQTEILTQWFSAAGVPVIALLHRAAGSVAGYVHLYRALGVLSILTATLVVYRLARRSRLLADGEAFFVAAVMGTYPAYQMTHELVMLPYAASQLFFFVGIWLYDRHVRSGAALSLAGAAGLVLVTLSFITPSLPALYSVALVYLFLEYRAGSGSWAQDLAAFTRRRAPEAALPLVGLAAMRLAFRPTGAYHGYNQIELAFGPALESMAKNVKYSTVDMPRALGEAVVGDPWTAVVLLPICAAAVMMLCRGMEIRTAEPAGRARCVRALAFGGVALLAAVAPYALVGKHASVSSPYDSRHALLVAGPMALVVVFSAVALVGRRWLRPVLLMVLIGGALVQLQSGILWETRYLKYLAISENIRREVPQLAGTVLVDDHARFGRTITMAPYEVNWVAKRALGDERRLGFDAQQFDEAFRERLIIDVDAGALMFSAYEPGGETTQIAVHAGTDLADGAIFARYHLVGREARARLIESLVWIEVTGGETARRADSERTAGRPAAPR